MDKVRKLILDRVRERETSLSALSKAMGKSHAYMQQYVHRNIPVTLKEAERAKLAELLDLDETLLGGPLPKLTAGPEARPDLVLVPMHDVEAAAGTGAVVGHESESGQWPFPRSYLRNSLAIRTNDLSMIEVRGDSMEPTLKSGDRILVDRSDRNVVVGGVFVLNFAGEAVVKRVEWIPNADPPKLMLISDNERHGRYDVPVDTVTVSGRVVWFGRRL